MQHFRFSLSALSLGIALGLGAPAFAETLQKPALDQLAAPLAGDDLVNIAGCSVSTTACTTRRR
jgi:hypothetical protein